jgi:hypothetical protein
MVKSVTLLKGPARAAASGVLMAVTFALTATTAAAHGHQPDAPKILILGEDRAHLRASVLRAAEAEVTRLYRAVGVDSTWLQIQPDGSGPESEEVSQPGVHLLIMIVPRETTARMAPAGALGLTPSEPGGESRVAYVFYDRVEGAAQSSGADLGTLLGCAIAHEIGHMLLPRPAHSATGIMRATWTDEDLQATAKGRLTLSHEQGEMIRTHLTALAAAATPSTAAVHQPGLDVSERMP